MTPLKPLLSAASLAVQEWAKKWKIEETPDLSGFFTKKTNFSTDTSLDPLDDAGRLEVMALWKQVKENCKQCSSTLPDDAQLRTLLPGTCAVQKTAEKLQFVLGDDDAIALLSTAKQEWRVFGDAPDLPEREEKNRQEGAKALVAILQYNEEHSSYREEIQAARAEEQYELWYENFGTSLALSAESSSLRAKVNVWNRGSPMLLHTLPT